MARRLIPLICLAVLGCNVDPGAPPPAAAVAVVEKPPSPKPARARAPKKTKRGAPTIPAASQPSPEQPTPCSDDMVLVEGDYCRAVEQRCLEYRKTKKGVEDHNRCIRYEQPSICTSTRAPRKMRYCMDRYEYPNKKGALPITLVEWGDAQRVCEDAGKRLCTESEFTFACEGEEMRPYTTGFTREPDKCNIDKPYNTPRRPMLPSAQCEANRACAAEMKRVDGRVPAGSLPDCVSPFGIHDLEGNANEWVSQPWKARSERAAIKGGWWGPVRNRCRAITLSHGESYMGYEVGFRCCKDATRPKTARAR
jgi:hypothetical protein